MNAAPTSAKPVIWFDDECGTDRGQALAPWQRALHAEQSKGSLKLITCNRVGEFARCLREGVSDNAGKPRPFALLVIDVMLTNEPEQTYASLGFEDELIIKLDAGAQIAALIRSRMFDADRPDWLGVYVDVPMMLLSSSLNLRALVTEKVGHTRMTSLKMVPKNLVTRAGHSGIDADPEFSITLRELLADD